jgi:hypothetical protein
MVAVGSLLLVLLLSLIVVRIAAEVYPPALIEVNHQHRAELPLQIFVSPRGEMIMFKGLLLWLIGIPIPIIILLFLLF